MVSNSFSCLTRLDLVVSVKSGLLIITVLSNVFYPRFNTHTGVGIFISVRVGDKLQENVKLVKDGRESRVASVICHNLDAETWINVYLERFPPEFIW